MNKFIKNNKGFTLVEVIVVAVIVLILAAVAIPLYNGYIRDTRASVAESTAGSIAAAIAAQAQSRGLTPTAAAALTTQVDWINGPTDDNNGRTLVSITHLGSAGETSQIMVPAGYTFSMTAGCVIVTWVGTGETQENGGPVGRAPVASGVQDCASAGGTAS